MTAADNYSKELHSPKGEHGYDKLDDTKRGFYLKWRAERTDGTSGPHGKHRFCDYFVLDLAHDPYALPALGAYAGACRTTHPKLAEDLLRMLKTLQPVDADCVTAPDGSCSAAQCRLHSPKK